MNVCEQILNCKKDPNTSQPVFKDISRMYTQSKISGHVERIATSKCIGDSKFCCFMM